VRRGEYTCTTLYVTSHTLATRPPHYQSLSLNAELGIMDIHHSDTVFHVFLLCVQRIKHYAMKGYGGSGCIEPHFLDFGTGWR
jgi:hypothetical protein